MTFASRLALRDAGRPVLQTSKGSIGLAELHAARFRPGMQHKKPVAVSIQDPASLLTMLVACDGHVPAILLLLYNLAPDLVEMLAAKVGCETIVSDRGDIPGALAPRAALVFDRRSCVDPIFQTSWIMTTSGTTGLPKMVEHRLEGLARTVRPWLGEQSPPVWGLAYEASRFAGMQVLLQATLGGGVLVACDPEMNAAAKIAHLAKFGVTHISATPTLWRQFFMLPAFARLKLKQITLGGEIADQPLLDRLAGRFPEARISHLYASTETGVGFSVTDGREGFPADYLQKDLNGVRLKLADGRLWVRTPGLQPVSLDAAHAIRRDEDGYADTLDRVERRGERVFFLGRDTGAINIGGLKVYPETVERIISQLSNVALVRVVPRRNPISGAVLVAHIVPAHPELDPDALRVRVIEHCRALLPREAVPAHVQLDNSLMVNAAGKLARSG
jgi:acyl-CoA synthetase (AMP-forming)/AMP-acid ligase II